MMQVFWDTADGFFIPFSTEHNQACVQLERIVAGLSLPKNASLYLRGSILEEAQPHPSADIDIIMVCDNQRPDEMFIKQLLEQLSILDRDVDLSILSAAEAQRSIQHRLLLHTRSVRLCGKARHFDPVAANLDTMKAHLCAYAPSFPPDIFVASLRSRVSALKNLTRCFGVFMFVAGGRFTRDVPTCIEHACALKQDIGQMLRSAWRDVEIRKPIELKAIKQFICGYALKTGCI